MGKNKKQRAKAREHKAMKENENKPHVTEIKKEPGCKKRKQEHTDKFDSDETHQKSPTRKNMDSSSLINYQQDVNGGDESNVTKNEVGMSKQIDANAVYFDNSEQGGFTDQNIKSDNISSSITHSTGENNQNENEPSDLLDDKNTHEEMNNGPSEVKNIDEDFICDKPGKGVPLNLNKSAVNVSSNILITEQTFKESELTSFVPNDKRTSCTETGTKSEPLDDLSKENTENGKETDDGDGFINKNENGESINGHIPQSKADLDKEITEDDTGGIGFDGVQNQQGQSQGDFTDEETGDNTFRSSITDETLDNNQNEAETTENENNLMSDTITGPHSEEDDHDGYIGAKNDTETFAIFNTREDDRGKSDDEQQFIKSDSCINMAGDDIPQGPEYQEKNYHNQENFADINHRKGNSTYTNTINCEEQCGSTSSTPNIDSSDQTQNDQLSQMNDINVQAGSSTTLQGVHQLSTFSQSEIEGPSRYDFMDDKNSPEEGINDKSEIKTSPGEFIGNKQGKCVHVNLNYSADDTSSTTASNEFDSTDNVYTDESNMLDTTHEGFRNHQQIQLESTNRLAEENIGNDDYRSSLNENTVEKENRKHLNVQIQQSVVETEKAFHQKLETLQQQLESVTKENGNLSECKSRLENELKCEKQELDVWKERANELESEKEDRDQLENKYEEVLKELEELKEKAAMLENQEDVITESWKESTEKTQQKLTSFELELTSVCQEKEQVVEHNNQLEAQLLQVNDELEGWKQNNARLESQKEEIQQSMEETKQSLHQELSLLENQLDSVNQENSNIQDEKNQLVQSQQELKDELKECKSKLAMLENRKEQLNISTKVIEETIKQQYSEIQSHLESNGSEGQDYKILSDEKNQLEEQLMQVNSELDEMKEKLVTLENVTGEKDQLEQELDRMRDVASQLESMKEENERYRVQYQQITDQLRTTEQQLEQSCQECEGLSADLVRKSEKEDHYRYIETMVVTLGREKESHLKEIQELKNKIDLVEEVLISLKEEKKRKDETIKQLRADVQIKEENSHQIKRQYEAGIEQLQTMGQLRDSEIENQKREIARISSQKQQLEGNIVQTSLELQTRQGDLQREQLEHNETRNTLTQYMEAIKKMNSQVQSKDKEIEIMQEEVNKVRIESRELQLKYRDLPQKEAHFKVIENSNQYLMDENAQLQERIRSFGPFESTLHYIREENSRLSWESQRYQERISFMEQKYRDQTCNIQQLTEEVQVFRGHRIELKRQLHQKTDEAEAVSRRLKETLEKKESLEKALLDAQEENSTYPESQTFDDSHGTEVHSFQGQRNSRGRIIRRTDIQNF